MAKKIFGETKYLVHGGEKEQRRKRRKIFGEGKFVEEKEKKEHIIETEKLLRVDGTGLKGSLRNL